MWISRAASTGHRLAQARWRTAARTWSGLTVIKAQADALNVSVGRPLLGEPTASWTWLQTWLPGQSGSCGTSSVISTPQRLPLAVSIASAVCRWRMVAPIANSPLSPEDGGDGRVGERGTNWLHPTSGVGGTQVPVCRSQRSGLPVDARPPGHERAVGWATPPRPPHRRSIKRRRRRERRRRSRHRRMPRESSIRCPRPIGSVPSQSDR